MSRRTDIRDAFAALLTGLPTTGPRVYQSRTRPVTATQLPALLIFSSDAEALSFPVGSMQPDLMRWNLRVDVLIKDVSGGEATADAILDEISSALFSTVEDNTLGGLVSNIRLLQIDEPDLDDSTDKPALRLPILFETQYAP